MSERRWLMSQTWEHLLFAHWPLAPEVLAPLLPAGLPLDTYEGQAWLGVVPFTMRDIKLRGLPAVPGTSAFHELNVRTYVVRDGRPGVWFFSLDAASRLAVAVARRWFHLNYVFARMSLVHDGEWVAYDSRRVRASDPPGAFTGRYRPVGEAVTAAPGSLEHFLTERYCLYAESPDGRLFRGDIAHPPWPLQPAEAVITQNTMAGAAGIALPDAPPLCHFARRMEMQAWAPTRVG